MRPRVKGSLLWGLVGALSFLVLAQGYVLVTDERLSLVTLLGVALVVGAVAVGSTYVAEGWLAEKRRV